IPLFCKQLFRLVELQPARAAWIGDIRAGTTVSYGNQIKASCHLIAFNADSAGKAVGGGCLGCVCNAGSGHADPGADIRPLSEIGDLLCKVLDSSLIDQRLWCLSENGQDLPASAGVILGPEGCQVDMLQFHSTADGVLASGAGRRVKIWDVAQQQSLTELESHGDQLQSLAWKQDGALLGTSCKVITIVSSVFQSVQGHENNKDSRLIWMDASDYLLSVGFNQMREREVKLWDTRRFSHSLLSCALDSSSGYVWVPLCPGNPRVWGENLLYCFEVSPLQPALTQVNQCVTEGKTQGAALVPKLALDVMACEVARVLQLTDSFIVPISYTVPRKSVQEFHEDLFPDSAGTLPSASSQEWWAGDNKQVTPGPSSKFRHAQGTVLHRDTHITNLKGLNLTTPGECNGFCANQQRLAVPLLSAGGQIAILELSKPGRLPDTSIPTIQNGTPVADFCWDPFDLQRLAVAGEDAKIRIWRIPPGGLQKMLLEPEAVLRGHTEKIYSIQFHPQAADILASSSYDMTVRIWDLRTKQEVLCLKGHTDQIFSLAWSPDGRKLATVSKDGRVRLYKPRQSLEPEQDGPGPEGSRGARVVWACGGHYLLVSGFDSRSERQLYLYKADSLSAGPIAVGTVDVSPSTLIPFYDEDTSVVFLTGKGDTRVFVYEIVTEAPFFLECNSFSSSDPHKGFVFLPKTTCNVREVEFARALRLRQSSVEPVVFKVPRVKKEFFQDDIFPPTTVWWEPALTATAWLTGSNAQHQMLNLQPKDMTPVSEAPKDVPVRKYAPSSVYLEEKSDEQKKEELLSAMVAKLGNREDPLPQDSFEGVDEDEWVGRHG
uniref:Coronin n=1 Tax=Crocodylus porosus TaxID=8502 RepID=A0A7M4FSA4_CROPO